MKTGQTVVQSIGHSAFDDTTWKGNSLKQNDLSNRTYRVGMTLLRFGLVGFITTAVLYALMCLTGGLAPIYASTNIFDVGASMFDGIYEAAKGIAAWAAIAGAVFCLLGIFFQRDEKAVAGKIKGLIVIGLAYVGIFVLPNMIQTIKELMENAGVNDVRGLT